MADTLEHLIHCAEVIELDVLGEADGQVDLHFVEEVLDALHDQVCALVELFQPLDRLIQLDVIPIDLAHFGKWNSFTGTILGLQFFH